VNISDTTVLEATLKNGHGATTFYTKWILCAVPLHSDNFTDTINGTEQKHDHELATFIFLFPI
jgi:hypothetical protein